MAHRDDEGDYQIIGRLDDATAIKGVWLDVAGIEDTMVHSHFGILLSVFKLYYHDNIDFSPSNHLHRI